MKTLKAIFNFLKKKEVKIWSAIMAGVVVVAFCVMSWVMISEKIVFAQIATDTRITTEKSAFDFVPHLNNVDTIIVTSESEELSQNTVQFNNNMIGGKYDEVVLKSEAKAVNEIMDKLDRGRRTNSFAQFFTGGQSGTERLTQKYTSSLEFEEASQGYSIKIIFAIPQFVVNRDAQGQPWRLEEYDPAYMRHVDPETGNFFGQIPSEYQKSVVTAISIPLGGVSNSFTEQTWYISIGSREMSNASATATLGYTFKTYGNYYNLLKYVRNIDDNFLL